MIPTGEQLALLARFRATQSSRLLARGRFCRATPDAPDMRAARASRKESR